MEIKDINALTNMVKGKTASVSTAEKNKEGQSAAGLEFINLLNNKSFIKVSSTMENDAKTLSVQKADKNNQNDTQEVSTTKEKKSSEIAKKEPEEKKEYKTEEREEINPQEEGVDKTAVENKGKEEKTQTSDKNKNIEESTPIENKELPTQEMNEENGENVVYGEVIALPILEQMGAVTVYNAETDSYNVMTGEEIVSLIQSEGNVSAVLSSDGKSDITLVSNENIFQNTNETGQIKAQTSAVPAEIMQGMTEVEGTEILPETDNMLTADNKSDKKLTKNSQENINQGVEKAPELIEEASKLGEVIGEGKKAEVKVKVQEESFSYSGAKEDISALKVLQAAEHVEGQGIKNAGEQAAEEIIQPTTEKNNSQTQIPQTNIWGNTATIQQPTANNSNTSAEISAISGKGGDTSTHNAGSLLSSEVSQLSKTQARTDIENKTSLKDVYKGLGKEAVEQIKVNITKSAVKGVDTIQVQLKPEELGHIEIKMQLAKDGKLQAHIISSRADTMEMLQKEIPALEKAFNEAGFETDSNSFSFSYREDAQSRQENNAESNLRDFIGNILDNEKTAEGLNEEAMGYNQIWDGTSALNIRV